MRDPRQVYSARLERFLTTLYADPDALARFLASPETEACRAGLTEQQRLKLKDLDIAGLKLASRSFANKRASKSAALKSSRSGWWTKISATFPRSWWFSSKR
jgi:hypothetical protein